MAIQIQCFYCEKQFLMRSANTYFEFEIFPNPQTRIETECPYCGRLNQELLRPVKPKFDSATVPLEFQEILETKQAVFDFYHDYLPDDWPISDPRYVTTKELVNNVQPSTAFIEVAEAIRKEITEELQFNEDPERIYIYDEFGGIVASVSDEVKKPETDFDEDLDPFEGIPKT